MIPSKLQKGMKFKPQVIDRINELIDYLKTQRIITDRKTIIANQLTNGIALHATPSNVSPSNGSGSGSFNHPFKLSIGEVQNIGKVLHIAKGRIAISGDDQSRIYVCFEPNTQGFLSYVPLPQNEGTYQINLLVFYDIQTQSENQDFWEIRIVYNNLTSSRNFVNSCGMFSFLLGYVTVTEDENNNLNYALSNQTLTSGFSIYDGDILHPFKAYYGVSSYPQNGDVLNSDIVPSKLIVNAGSIFLESIAHTSSYTLNNPSNDTLIIASLNTNNNTASITNVAISNFQYTSGDGTYNIPICKVETNGASAYGIIQYIDDDFAFGIDTYKVKFQTTDTPSYLPDKFATDNTVSSVIELSKNYNTNTIILKSTLGQNTDAFIVARSGDLHALTIPSQGQYILSLNNGVLRWLEYADCEDACSSSSSSSSSILGAL